MHFGSRARRERVQACPPHLERHLVVRQQHTHDREVARRDLAQRPTGHPRLHIIVEPDGEVTTFARHARPRGFDQVPSDDIEHDLGTTAVGVAHDAIEHVARCRVDDQRCPELRTHRTLVTTGDRDHVGARRDTELDGRRTNTTGAAYHHQRLAGGEPGAFVQCQVGHMERQCERSCLGVVELGGCGEHTVHGSERRVGNAAERHGRDRDDATADPLCRAVARGIDHTADVHTECERWRDHDAGEGAPAAGNVTKVQRRRRHRDAHRSRACFGNSKVSNLDCFDWPTMPHDLSCSHGGSTYTQEGHAYEGMAGTSCGTTVVRAATRRHRQAAARCRRGPRAHPVRRLELQRDRWVPLPLRNDQPAAPLYPRHGSCRRRRGGRAGRGELARAPRNGQRERRVRRLCRVGRGARRHGVRRSHVTRRLRGSCVLLSLPLGMARHPRTRPGTARRMGAGARRRRRGGFGRGATRRGGRCTGDRNRGRLGQGGELSRARRRSSRSTTATRTSSPPCSTRPMVPASISSSTVSVERRRFVLCGAWPATVGS